MKYTVIGLMSGTSLDGLDIAFCEFEIVNGSWIYRILTAETLPYSREWKNRLSGVEKGTAYELAMADIDFGHFSGKLVKDFMLRHRINPDFIASHGHTIFHQPEKGLTWQIGKGSAIAAETGVPVVSDFRALDVALGGQGAPLVPIGDKLLFNEFDYCLNLGGFANISSDENGRRIAYDICAVNIVLNHLAGMIGKTFDPSGQMASIGTLSPTLLASLNQLPYYTHKPPKSLGKEWVVANIYPLLDRSTLPVNDQLNTFCEHVAMQVAKATGEMGNKKMLVTGGGAFNEYLMKRIIHHSANNVIIPDDHTVNFKEALIFAFLGVLRWRGEVNCLKSVTGARNDNIGGSVFLV